MTLINVLAVGVLLLPGLAYDIVRERNTPRRRRSAYREAAVVAAASAIANATALLVLALARLRWPAQTPHIARLIRGDVGYLADHYALVFGWVYVLVAVATIVAAFIAWWRRRAHTSTMSSWWAMFEAHEDAEGSLHFDREKKDPVQVSVVLDDGTFIAGRLWTYSQEADETPDRDIVLREPILHRPIGEETLAVYPAGGACISASKIATMFVSHLPKEYWDDELFRASLVDEAVASEDASAAAGPQDAAPVSPPTATTQDASQ